MTSLIFLLTVLFILVLLITGVVKAIRQKPSRKIFKSIIFIVGGYAVIWFVFYLLQKNLTIPFGSDVCFDDWCATITKIEKGPVLQKQFSQIKTDSTWVILDIRVSNHARGIAQRPSEPRIHILDDKGNSWAYSAKGQELLETTSGKQIPIDQKLELHQSLDTKLVYAVPADASGLKILIEEGPFITKLLFPDDNMVFSVR